MFKRFTYAALALAILALAYSPIAHTQSMRLLYGSFSGAAKAVTVTSNGYLNVSVQGGASLASTSTCATPGYAFAGNPNYGMNLSGTNLQFCANGSAYVVLATGALQVNSASLSFANAGTNKFSFAAVSATDGQDVISNGNGTAGVGLDVATDGTLKLRGRAFAAGSGNLDIGAKITSYNQLTTAGSGVPFLVSAGDGVAISSSLDASRCTFTPAADGSFEVWDYILVTTAGAATNMNGTITFKSEEGTARSVAVVWQLAAGGTVTNVTTATGTVGYYGVPIRIRAQAATAITVSTTGTPSTAVYNQRCSIMQIS
jgi:hypothetical protein